MRRLAREIIETILLALLIFVTMQAAVQNYRVDGPSMLDTLSSDEQLILNKLIYMRLDRDTLSSFLPFVSASKSGTKESFHIFHPPEHGDIVIFEYPLDRSRHLIKRVIGVPGDSIEIERGTVYRNGEALSEPYITKSDIRSREALTVPPEAYYVLGDNRLASNDSRAWGFVSAESIIGRAWLRYWPLENFGLLQ